MPLIEITQTAQHSAEKKRELVETITQAYAKVTGIDEAKVWVIIKEIPRDSWGTGGVPLADRDNAAKG